MESWNEGRRTSGKFLARLDELSVGYLRVIRAKQRVEAMRGKGRGSFASRDSLARCICVGDPALRELCLMSTYCAAKIDENTDRNCSIFEVAKLKRRRRRGEFRAINSLKL